AKCAVAASCAVCLVYFFLLSVRIFRRVVVNTQDWCRPRRSNEELGGGRTCSTVLFGSRGGGCQSGRRLGPPEDFLATLESQGGSAEIHWRGIALRPGRVRIRTSPKSTWRSCASAVSGGAAIDCDA